MFKTLNLSSSLSTNVKYYIISSIFGFSKIFKGISGSIKAYKSSRVTTTNSNSLKKPFHILAPPKIVINTKSFSCITENNVNYNTKTFNQYKCKGIEECCDICGNLS